MTRRRLLALLCLVFVGGYAVGGYAEAFAWHPLVIAAVLTAVALLLGAVVDRVARPRGRVVGVIIAEPPP